MYFVDTLTSAQLRTDIDVFLLNVRFTDAGKDASTSFTSGVLLPQQGKHSRKGQGKAGKGA